MRVLYYIPIVHSGEEMGTFGPLLQEVEEKESGKQEVVRRTREIQNYYRLVEEKLAQIPFEYDKLFIYMDSLPADEQTKKQMCEDHIQRGFRPYPIIEELTKKGAKLIGTESPELLRQEYSFLQRVVVHGCLSRQDPEEAELLLKKRDEFIAQRINETLPDNCQGILFIGRLHRVIEELDELEESGGLKYPLRVVYV